MKGLDNNTLGDQNCLQNFSY